MRGAGNDPPSTLLALHDSSIIAVVSLSTMSIRQEREEIQSGNAFDSSIVMIVRVQLGIASNSLCSGRTISLQRVQRTEHGWLGSCRCQEQETLLFSSAHLQIRLFASTTATRLNDTTVMPPIYFCCPAGQDSIEQSVLVHRSAKAPSPINRCAFFAHNVASHSFISPTRGLLE
jgi:hypothetical protein